MKKKLKLCVLAIVPFVTMGCAKEFLINGTVGPTYDEGVSEVINKTDAINELNMIISELEPNTKSGTIQKYSKSDIETICLKDLSAYTKSANTISLPDTLLYVVNFDNNEGYAIMSANKKIGNGVLCVTEEGKIDISNFVESYKLLENIIKDNNKEDSRLLVSSTRNIIPSIIISSAYNIYNYGADDNSIIETKAEPAGRKYGPYLKTKWNQTADPNAITPFNKYTPRHTYAGCVAIAVAQIMQFNKKPAKPIFNNVQCDWDEMEQVANYKNKHYYGNAEQFDQVANFIYGVGQKQNCYVRYDDGSWAVADGAVRTLKNYNYSNVDKRLGFENGDKKKVAAQIKAGRPVYMGGCLKGTTSQGHAWVIDGLCGDYYHINWGWGGDCDGYFKIGVFDTTAKYGPDDEIDKNVTNRQKLNFTWTYRIILYS